ncbi:MAG: metal ABC transporter permease, partial [Desulfovibrionaceae bacterium]|nr:metal ABC transporter permease [Desulfovibrionaceae bacterium]
VFLSGGIAHASFGGVGLAVCLGLPVLPVTALFALCAALSMSWLSQRARMFEDAVIGVIWASGMALGVLLLNLAPGYGVDPMSYLFGSVLAVSGTDNLLMAGAALADAVLCAAFYKGFEAMSFEEDFARARGVPVVGLYYLLMCMVAVSIVMVMRVVGLILVIALLTIPPLMVMGRVKKLSSMILWSIGLCLFFGVLGLVVSYVLDLTAGATIIAVAGLFFVLSLVLPGRMRRER